MDELLTQLQAILNAVKINLPLTLLIIGGLWLIHVINLCVGKKLNYLGVYPRRLPGLIGLPFFSFLHGDFNHLFFNSIPLFVLINFILLSGLIKFISITFTIIFLSGIGIWFFGRRAIHIGASSLIMGYWSYLLGHAYQHPSALTVILAILCVYYFAGLFFALFPAEEEVSWEGHLFGFLAGIAAMYLYP